jgi:HAD superfamily hydrolase (TIGR01509 family)
MLQLNPSAILFDLDGVIVLSEEHWVATEATFLADLLQNWTANDQDRLIGLSIPDVYSLLRSDYGLKVEWSEFLQHYECRADQIYSELAKEVPGSVATIKRAAKNGLKTAIVSNSPRAWIQLVIKRFELENSLNCFVSSEDVSAPGKPHPAVYLRALEILEVSADKTVAVEDSSKGIAAVLAAGINAVGLLNGYNSARQVASSSQVVQGFSDPWWTKAIFEGSTQTSNTL